MPQHTHIHIQHPNLYLTAVNYCCKELRSASDKGLSQQPETLLKSNYFTYVLARYGGEEDTTIFSFCHFHLS